MTLRKPSGRWTIGWTAALSACLVATPAIAQDEIDEIVVEGSLNSLPTQDVGSVFGLDKTLLETPRSASTISSDQLDRFDIVDIDELVALAPGTFTQSFFGVAGALDIRGTSGETYFRGIRRLDNPGNYPTPIGASDRIDIVRGPASMVYGPAKIGGYLNFVPKSARADGGQYLDEIEGRVSYTTGSWDRNVMTGEVGGPGTIAGRDFGYYLYGEVEDSGSFYQNTATDQTLLQMAIDHDVNDSLHIQFGGMYHRFEGNQIAGWNRLTQDLIDNGTYITGLAQPLDTNLDGSISHDEYNAAGISQFFFAGPSTVTEAALNPLSALENPGTAQLDESQVLVAPDDQLNNEVMTLYFDAIYQTDNNWEIKNQLFYEKYDNVNENAYGFSQFHDSWVIEDKLVFQRAFETDAVTTTLQISPSIRFTDFNHGSDFINEYFDRRDLTGPSTARDRRLLSTRSGTDYSDRFEGDYLNYGLAVLGDFVFTNGLSVLLGARYDDIDVESTSVDAELLFPGGDPLFAEDNESGLSWTASVSWETPIGLIPYVTASEQATVVAGQGAEISSDDVENEAWFDTSELLEFGVKGSFLDDSLYVALAVYEQERTDRNAQAIVTNQTSQTEGIELEARWVVNENLVLTFGYTHIEVINLTTLEDGGRFSFFGADDIPQIDPTLVFGGQAIGIVPTPVPGDDGARRAGMPENIFSFTGTYAFDNGIAVNASIVDVESVSSGFSQAVTLPAYTLVNLGVVYETEAWTFALTGKNLTDERYFRANFPNLFGSQIVLPELPRNWQASISYSF
ncbi:MAG: TonB-dependent receptor plug domain-containing protein [Pseudomonadota bacterium]